MSAGLRGMPGRGASAGPAQSPFSGLSVRSRLRPGFFSCLRSVCGAGRSAATAPNRQRFCAVGPEGVRGRRP